VKERKWAMEDQIQYGTLQSTQRAGLTFIKLKRLQWVGYVQRLPLDHIPKNNSQSHFHKQLTNQKTQKEMGRCN
jgi:hypothetical protein